MLITEAIKKFVDREYESLKIEDREKKMKEVLVGYEGYKKINGNFFVVLRLPEGAEAAIDSQGRLYDLNEI
jgi:hypothetical protein